MFRFRTHILAVVAVTLAFSGCDSTTTTRADSELIVGSWLGSSLNARLIGGISVAIPGTDASDASAAFGEDGSFSFLFDPEDGSTLGIPQTGISVSLPDQVTLNGTYTLNEGTETISVTRPGIPAALQLGYRFRGDNDLELIADSPEAFSTLLGLASKDAAIIATVITGGSIRFNRQ